MSTTERWHQFLEALDGYDPLATERAEAERAHALGEDAWRNARRAGLKWILGILAACSVFAGVLFLDSMREQLWSGSARADMLLSLASLASLGLIIYAGCWHAPSEGPATAREHAFAEHMRLTNRLLTPDEIDWVLLCCRRAPELACRVGKWREGGRQLNATDYRLVAEGRHAHRLLRQGSDLDALMDQHREIASVPASPFMLPSDGWSHLHFAR